MRGIYNSNLSASRKRIKKAHSKAKLVSGLYTLGSLVLMVLVFLTTLNVKFAGNYSLSIATFFRPLIGIFKEMNLVAVVSMVLYLFMVVFAIINFFKCFSKFGRILRRSYKNITTCNKNMLLMEEAGDAFSRTFVAYVIISFIITMLSYAQVDAAGNVIQMPFTLFGLIALAVGLVIHFVAGTIGGTISIFIVGASVEEKQREDKVGIFLLRNLVQVIVIAAIWYFFVPATNLYDQLGLMANKSPECLLTNPSKDMLAFIGLVLQPVACIWIIFLIKHSLSTTEYNLSGMYGPGMNVFRVFSIFTGITAAGLFVLDLFKGEMISNYLLVAIVALVGFILDLIIKPRIPREPEPEEEIEEEELPKEETKEQPKEQPQVCPLLRPCLAGCGTRRPQPAQKPAEEGEEPAPPVVDYDEYVWTRNGDTPPRPAGGLPYGMHPSIPAQEPAAPTLWEVSCPNCHKQLSVKDGVKFNRCPSCGKVFQVRLGKLVSPDADAPVPVEEEELPIQKGKKQKKEKVKKVKEKQKKSKKESVEK